MQLSLQDKKEIKKGARCQTWRVAGSLGVQCCHTKLVSQIGASDFLLLPVLPPVAFLLLRAI